VPIALAANVARITGTAILMERWDPDLAYKFFHNWAGWLMMVFAFALLVLEIVLLRHLFPQVKHAKRPPTKPLPLPFKRRVVCSSWRLRPARSVPQSRKRQRPCQLRCSSRF